MALRPTSARIRVRSSGVLRLFRGGDYGRRRILPRAGDPQGPKTAWASMLISSAPRAMRGTPAHRVVGNDRPNRTIVLGEGRSDLARRQDQPSRSVQDDGLQC